MAWDEALFQKLFNAVRVIVRRDTAPAELARAAGLADQQQRLQLLAGALSGERLVVRTAEAGGGWQGDDILLPASISDAPTRVGNASVYLLRVAYACTSRRLGFTLTNVEADDAERALVTWLAVPATRRAMHEELPGIAQAEAAAFIAMLAARPEPSRRSAASAALEALVRLRLGTTAADLEPQIPDAALAWAAQAHSFEPDTPAQLMAAAPPLLEALRQRLGHLRGVTAVPAWGWLMPHAAQQRRQTAAVPDALAQSLSSGTERRAKPRENVELLEQPENPLGENPLIHSYEKVHTLETYTGGRKNVDGSDEMDAHGDALDELDLRQVVRSARTTASVYQSDVGFENGIGDVAGESEPGGVLYDEWDEHGRRYRTDWCRVRSAPPRVASAIGTFAREVRLRHRRHIDELRAIFERIEAGRTWRLRQPDGPDIDIDAVIDRYARLRAGNCSSDKLYSARRRRSRDLAVLILLDASMSTDGWAANRRVIDVEKESVVVLGEALAGLYDEVGVAAFYSQTRRDCRFLTVKGFGETWEKGFERLSAVEPTGYTRIGPALRHATELLLRTGAKKRLLLLVSDGKPTDLDRYEGRYGIADVRQAVREAEAAAVETFALAVDAQARLYLPRMFGHSRFSILSSPAHLSKAMARVCAELLR
jgi:nitric oxide reductase activation protein